VKRSGLFVFAFSSAVLLGAGAACSELFDDPQQCAFDRDCEAVAKGSRCDIKQRICVPSTLASVDSGVTPPGPTGDGGAAPDADTFPAACDLSPKPEADVPGTVASTGQGVQIDLASDLTLDCSKDWRLGARLVVKSGAVLTIQAGTKVLMDKAANAGIVVQPGGRIVARGTADRPVVLTSNAPAPAVGDWRGLVLLGAAPPTGGTVDGVDPLLGYGGNAADDSSGALEFVRIEWSTAGLILGGVGNKTSLDGIQVRRSNDNCFVFTGGTAQAKHLVCQFPADEMFEMNAGFNGKLQYVFGSKTPAGPNHNGVLADSSFPQVYNATICGNNVANQGSGLLFRNGARLDFANAIVTGWGLGVEAGGNIGNPLEVRSSVIAENATNPANAVDAGFDTLAMLNDQGRANRFTPAGLVDCYDPAAPKPWPGTAIVGRTPPNDGFFDTAATYVGAVRDANDPWLRAPWIVW
jgi:hypothetical protein